MAAKPPINPSKAQTPIAEDDGGIGSSSKIKEVIPKRGYLHCEDELTFVLCKPKLLPLKSFTMEKLEKIQAESVEKAKEMMENSNAYYICTILTFEDELTSE
ncbi:BBSome-interacting protein 1 [Folsomia candida]|uniref:BBSome-interacting protein 1 n=1 Tax=Folsomia candida TaxID=158441 RepID=A0A226DBP9_FOLCA|nr:BBSome-interacting protein 1 [Folsomia candida]